MPHDATELARRLAHHAQAVCEHYLSNGRRQGRYWQVGDLHNTPGRSMYVRLLGPACGPGAAGKWSDAATGEHGDLLDLIALQRGHTRLSETLEEVRSFLSLPRMEPGRARTPLTRDSSHAARRLFLSSRPVMGTLAQTYLISRGILCELPPSALRFHASCYCRLSEHHPPESWPALIAAVTDAHGAITGVQRTWLSRDGLAKAPFADPRRSLGRLLGNGVRIGSAAEVLAVGEGIETTLTLRAALPELPVIAALSASHLAALHFTPGLKRLYVAVDRDRDGRAAASRLINRACEANIQAFRLEPTTHDWNHDLMQLGLDYVRQTLAIQLSPNDARRFGADDLGR